MQDLKSAKSPSTYDLLCSVQTEIGRLADLEDDWDSEGSPRIDAASIALAQEFIDRVGHATSSENVYRSMPSVNAAVDGGVQLYWSTAQGQTALTFRPGKAGYGFQQKARNAPGTYRTVPLEEALQIALQAMCSA